MSRRAPTLAEERAARVLGRLVVLGVQELAPVSAVTLAIQDGPRTKALKTLDHLAIDNPLRVWAAFAKLARRTP